MDALRATLAGVDRQIAEIARSANEQVRLIADLPPGSRERDAAVTLLADLNRSYEAWQSHRERMRIQLLELGKALPNGLEIRESARQRLLTDARRWRLKAEELWTAASGMKSESGLAALERLARDYELLADRAERRAGQERAPKESSGA